MKHKIQTILSIIFDNDWIFWTLLLVIPFLILCWFSHISIKLDKQRCEENGGIYIYEVSYGSKCHLKGE